MSRRGKARTADAAPSSGGLYYGWTLVATLGVTEAISWGILYYAFTVFVTPMQAELGWSRGDTTGAFSLALLLSGIAAVPVGRWLDRYGPRLLMTVGSCLGTLLVLAWSRVDSLLDLYLVWAGIGLVLATVLYQPAFAAVATWFVRRRSRAFTVLTLTAGWASVIFIPLAGWLIQVMPWRSALVTLALLLAAGTILPHALLLRRRPEDLGLRPDGDRRPPSPPAATVSRPSHSIGRVIRHRGFHWLTLAFCLAAFAESALSVHLVPYLLGTGYSVGVAAAAAGFIGLSALGSRVVYAPFADRLPDRSVALGTFVVQALSLLALVEVPGDVGLALFVILFGTSRGLVSPVRASIVADLYGLPHYASVSGLLALFVICAQAAAPIAAGVTFDALGRYEPVLWGLAALSLSAAGASLLIGPVDRPASDGAAREQPGSRSS